MAIAVPSANRRFSRQLAAPVSVGALELFVLLQFVPPALAFVPGANAFRQVIHALPYVSSLGMLAYFWMSPSRGRLPAGATLLSLALGLLALNLFHPDTDPGSGFPQLVLQLSIAAPLYWGARAVTNPVKMERLLSWIFVGNIASAVVGLLQTYYPERFMPPEFHNAAFAKIVTYTLATGQKLTRPPGLSDTAGGAAVAGAAVAIMGILFGSRPGLGLAKRAVCFGLAAIGFFDLFLTQIRSLFLMVLVAMAAVCFLLVRQRRPGQSAVIGTLTVGLVAGSLVWAIAVGGKPVSDRFLQLFEHDPFSTYQQNRGQFLEATFSELMFQYPFGAGLGRWGPMASYFGGRVADDLPAIHAELQLTGWLLDGGILMWFLYGGALLCSMYGVYRMTGPTGSARLTQCANLVFALNLLVLGQAMAGPSFNTTMGTQFWLLAAALHGTGERRGISPPVLSPPAGLRRAARRKVAVVA